MEEQQCVFNRDPLRRFRTFLPHKRMSEAFKLQNQHNPSDRSKNSLWVCIIWSSFLHRKDDRAVEWGLWKTNLSQEIIFLSLSWPCCEKKRTGKCHGSADLTSKSSAGPPLTVSIHFQMPSLNKWSQRSENQKPTRWYLISIGGLKASLMYRMLFPHCAEVLIYGQAISQAIKYPASL